ncbi:hypothetical protein Zm00014a_038365 [Zea mays]|uniref:Uncharacterized protein n=1 Tax=Zea mays TaxID=4577 RepID=A0A3L6EFJ8_MAIZE|nr:hypothetical protein Zm00014a_038365 [Zea mays]
MALPLQNGLPGRAPATPPPTQLMERLSSSDGSAEAEADADRIPAAVFERDPSESNKDWSMMSTESVFGLQVAPSSDFTGFFLAHPELMDIATPPRSSAVIDADNDAKAAPAIVSPPFESIPELPESAMKGNYSFAFPNLIEDKRNYSKKQSHRDHQPEAAAATTEAVKAAPAPPVAEAKAEPQPETRSKPEAGKGGLFSCFPCC